MTAGLHAPLPPARTGVADYAAALWKGLRRFGAVEIAPRSADVRLYHLGNNQLHRRIYARALAEPGVAVLHDAVLHHFFLGLLDAAAYQDEFVYNYGEWQRSLARELWNGRAASAAAARYFRYAMLRRIAEVSRAIVTHNAAAARMVREHAPGARVRVIPLLSEQPEPAPAWETAKFRHGLGIPPGAFLFGMFGYLRESKRLMPVLRVFERVRRVHARAALLVAGDLASADLARAAGPMLAQPGVVRLPHLPPAAFHTAMCAVDACINLRYPAAGETSAITVRAMAAGVPVLLTGSEENAEFPEAACLRIAAGAAEEDSLWRHMVLLTSSAGLAAEIGGRAARHIAAVHALDRVAEQYWNTLCEYRC
ncbi:MAG: hypothetical protein ACE15B_24800 [Bryobacteraceae bacterium]